MEFLGRRDSQLKIRGFRIELGEIENTLLRVPGVRDGAVVVAERADQSKHLVAFYSSPQPLDIDAVKDRLAESLPEYMVPSAFIWREQPAVDGQQQDRQEDIDQAGWGTQRRRGQLRRVHVRRPSSGWRPRWAKVLSVPPDQIGRLDHFFDRGGTSLSAVKLAVNLDRVFSLKDLTGHPVLADLAALVDGRSERRAELLQSISESDGEPGRRSRVLSVRRWQRGEFPADGPGAARQRAGGVRGRAARS